MLKEEEKLMKLDLQKETKKLEANQIQGMKLSFFRLIYVLLQNQTDSYFRDVAFIIVQFLQLMAFPMDTVFSTGWKNYWYGTVGHFFRYFQLIFLWYGNSQFYIISYIISSLYIIFFLILFTYTLRLLANYLLRSKSIIGILLTVYEFETLVNIPFLKILTAVFSCENDKLGVANDIKCKSGIHIGMILISIILIIFYLIVIFLFHMTLFEFGVIHGKLKAAFTSSTEVLLVMMKFILVIIYQFIKHQMALSLITLIIGLMLLFDFLGKRPFINGTITKLYLTLYLLFLWSGVTCTISLLLKNSKFEGGVLLLLLGFPFIILAVISKELEFTIERVFQYVGDKYKDGYKVLMEIEYFLKLEDSLEDKIRSRQQKILYSYITNYEQNCTDNDCSLKQFLNIELKVENFEDMKICLLQHAEMLYKTAVSKYPFNAKLRLSYAIFLYKRLNKKQKGTNEILLLNKYTTNLEDAFLIYRAQRYIEEENEGHSDSDSNVKTVNSVTFKAITNNIKSLIGKITTNYIDFWTILAISDESKSENFLKMSRIGTRISKLNEDLMNDIDRLERVNLYDQDTIKLYSQYLSEILNNQSKASIYNTKLIELEQRKHQYNEENLYDLNYKAMARSEDYKYIVISAIPANFGTICNLSLCMCHLFGFSKEELIGKPLEYVLPELFCIPHKKILLEKVEEFKKKLLGGGNKNLTARIRSEPKIVQSFGKTKMKYLVPVKMKIAMVSTEEGNIYGVTKIIADNHTIISNEREIAYILTDREFIVQNFTPNAPKLLNLHSFAINNNLDITDFIKEFREELLQEIVKYGDIKENNNRIFKQIKNDLIKKLFTSDKTVKVITWILADNANEQTNPEYKFSKFGSNINKNNSKISKKYNPKYSSAVNNDKNRPKIKGKNNFLSKSKIAENLISEESDRKNNSDIHEKRNTIVNNNSNDYNTDSFHRGSRFDFLASKKYNLSVSNVKLGESKIGYIFKFELYNGNNNIDESTVTSKSRVKRFKQPSMIKDNEPEKLDVSFVSFSQTIKPIEPKQIIFNATVDNPNGVNLGLDETYIPKLANENYFTIDITKMSYKQKNQIDKTTFTDPVIRLKQDALEKVAKIQKKLKNNDENSSEEEDSEDSYTYSEEESEHDSSLVCKEKKRLVEETKIEIANRITSNEDDNKEENNTENNIENNNNNFNNNLKSNSAKKCNLNFNQNKKDEYDDYFHVELSKITLFIYNYNTGFVESVKDPKFKISQVTKSLTAEKEKLTKMNTRLLAGTKPTKEKKKSGTAQKKASIGEDELDTYSDKKIKLKEIQKALASKEKQSSIINLCIISFAVFILIIGSAITSILMNAYLKNRTNIYYNLIEKSMTLYRNLLFEIFYVREMIMLANELYTNIYDTDNTTYYNNYTAECYQYYLETAFVLSNLSTTINTLSEENRQKIVGVKGELEIIDPLKSSNGDYVTKSYELLIYSAFNELNAALYHVSQMKMSEINSYEDNVYYFTRNAMNYMMVIAEEQIDNFTNEFYNEISKGHNIIFICITVMIVVYFSNFFLFVHFYQAVEERKQSYLAVFYEVGSGFIVSSLAKCEKFSQRMQIQDDTGGAKGEKISLESSSNDDSDIENDISSVASLKSLTENKKNNDGKARKVKKVSELNTKIGGFIVCFVLLAVQVFSYYYYYTRLSLYKNYVQYEYYNNKYNSRFLFPFIALREYLYDPKKILLMQEVDKYLDNSLITFYTDLANISNYRDKYTKYLPNSYSEFIDSIYRDEQCSYINNFLLEHPNAGFNTCEEFFYNTSNYGFQAVLTTYIEEIRIMRDLEVSYLQQAASYNFTYNESLVNTGYDNKHYKSFENDTEKMELYHKYNPALILQQDTHKTAVIIYRFVVMKVVQSALDNLFDAIHLAFDTTIKIGLIINIVFIGVVFFGFFAMWLPFVMGENETIYKTKNMLSIIPKEVLLTLPHINIMLGIDEGR